MHKVDVFYGGGWGKRGVGGEREETWKVSSHTEPEQHGDVANAVPLSGLLPCDGVWQQTWSLSHI